MKWRCSRSEECVWVEGVNEVLWVDISEIQTLSVYRVKQSTRMWVSHCSCSLSTPCAVSEPHRSLLWSMKFFWYLTLVSPDVSLSCLPFKTKTPHPSKMWEHTASPEDLNPLIQRCRITNLQCVRACVCVYGANHLPLVYKWKDSNMLHLLRSNLLLF